MSRASEIWTWDLRHESYFNLQYDDFDCSATTNGFCHFFVNNFFSVIFFVTTNSTQFLFLLSKMKAKIGCISRIMSWQISPTAFTLVCHIFCSITMKKNDMAFDWKCHQAIVHLYSTQKISKGNGGDNDKWMNILFSSIDKVYKHGIWYYRHKWIMDWSGI